MFLTKKEGYTLDEELNKYSNFSILLSDLCEENKKVCSELMIKNPMERKVILNDENFLKRLNNELAKDIETVKMRIDFKEKIPRVSDTEEFKQLYTKVNDYMGYINLLCRRYSDLCDQLEIPDPLSIPVYEDISYMKQLIRVLAGHISKLRRGVEQVETEKSKDINILYDFDE
jgi:hypothetical protein